MKSISTNPDRAAEGTARDWLVPLGGALGLIVGNGPISVFAFGVFIGPLESEFGWSRASLGIAIALCALLSAITLPFVGLLMDKFGVRRPMAIAICLFALNVAVIGQSATLPMFIALTALAGVTGAAQSPIGYVKSVASYFDRRRGLAIGIAMSGIGIGAALVPQYAHWLIASFGWRVGYMGLGIAIMAVALPSVLFLIREPVGDRTPGGAGGKAAPGMTLSEAVRLRAFWSIALAVLLVSIVVNGAIVHVVPLLVERGWSPGSATKVLVAAGVAGVAGRILAGYLMDKFFAAYVATGFFASAIAGIYLLASDANAVLGMVAIGLALGAEVDMIGFFASRYFGLKRFGQLYGVLFAIFTIGAGLGPLLLGTLYTHLHSYEAGFWTCGIGLAAAIVCVLMLGPYQYEPAGSRNSAATA
jgi:predicted MFS family arabinose efflux permease